MEKFNSENSLNWADYTVILSYFFLILVVNSKYIKGGSKVRVLGQGGACNSAPKGPNDLKFCMQGAFVCYY